MTIEELNYKFDPTPNGPIQVSFTVNTDWEASIEYDDGRYQWLEVTPTSGEAGDVTITMTAKENTILSDLRANIKITYGTEMKRLKVVQKCFDLTAEFDPLFAKELQKQKYIADANNIGFAELERITKLDLSKEVKLTSLRGIGYLKMLEELNCRSQEIADLDLSKNAALTFLMCSENKLTYLDVSQNKLLKELYCSNNQLTSLDVSNSKALLSLNCDNNKLISLDVIENVLLKSLGCRSNQLTSLDVSNNTALKSLFCYNNLLTSIDISNNTKLYYFFAIIIQVMKRYFR